MTTAKPSAANLAMKARQWNRPTESMQPRGYGSLAEQQSIGTNASMVEANVDGQKSDGLEDDMTCRLGGMRYFLNF